MSGSVYHGEVCIDLFVIDTQCIPEVDLSKVALEAFPRYLFLRFGALRTSHLPMRGYCYTAAPSASDPVRRRCSSSFGVAADRGIGSSLSSRISV